MIKQITVIILLFFVIGCNPEVKPIIGENGGKYYLYEKGYEPSEENNWIGRIDLYTKEGSDTIHILIDDGSDTRPPTFKDTNEIIIND